MEKIERNPPKQLPLCIHKVNKLSRGKPKQRSQRRPREVPPRYRDVEAFINFSDMRGNGLSARVINRGSPIPWPYFAGYFRSSDRPMGDITSFKVLGPRWCSAIQRAEHNTSGRVQKYTPPGCIAGSPRIPICLLMSDSRRGARVLTHVPKNSLDNELNGSVPGPINLVRPGYDHRGRWSPSQPRSWIPR